MRKLRFLIESCVIGGMSDSAYLPTRGDLDEDEDLTTELIEAAHQSIGTDLEVTVSGVTMFIAAWEDPDHWASDWAEKLGISYDDVPDAVAALLTAAVEERP